MTSNYEFCGCLYNTRADMIAEMAYSWMTADGLNSPETIDSFEGTPVDYAQEAIAEWDLGDVTEAELEAAIAEFLATRPDRDE